MYLKDSEKVNFNFESVAILPEDIERYNLPTRPTKKTDSRSAKFEGESAELDTMDMRTIKQRVNDCIMENVPPSLWKKPWRSNEPIRTHINIAY